jgi:AbiTii
VSFADVVPFVLLVSVAVLAMERVVKSVLTYMLALQVERDAGPKALVEVAKFVQAVDERRRGWWHRLRWWRRKESHDEDSLPESDAVSPPVSRTDRLLQEIDEEAPDHRAPIADVLRKAIALGDKAGSAELRDWATHELLGYAHGDELPQYRRIAAPLHMDTRPVRGRALSPIELPSFAQDAVTNIVRLRKGIAEIEGLAGECLLGDLVRIEPRGSQELVSYMNSQPKWSGRIERIYWSVSPAVLLAVVDQVRTTLTILVAEINATMPEGTTTPPAEVATNAVNVAVTGKRNKIKFLARQANGPSTTTSPDERPPRWLRIAGVVLLGLVAIAGTIFALMQAQGWKFS